MRKALSLLTLAGFFLLGAPSIWAQGKDLKWGTSAVGSAGHKTLVNLASVLNREMPEYRIAVLPMAGAILTVKAYATGQIEGFYGADIGFYELANDAGRFKGFKPNIKRQPVQSFWTYTMEVGAAVHQRDRGKFRQWRDLTGQPVFTGPLPWDVRAQLERALGVLGAKHRYVNVDLATAGSALDAGTIRAFITYTSAESAVAPWIVEASLSTDVAILNPSAAELDVLKKAGFQIAEVNPRVFKKDVHVDKIFYLPFFYGFHVGLEVPEKDVYRMLTVIEKNAKELAKADAGLVQIAKDMPAMQRRGVESAINLVPVHPGLARYMRERGVWDSKWNGRIAKAQ